MKIKKCLNHHLDKLCWRRVLLILDRSMLHLGLFPWIRLTGLLAIFSETITLTPHTKSPPKKIQKHPTNLDQKRINPILGHQLTVGCFLRFRDPYYLVMVYMFMFHNSHPYNWVVCTSPVSNNQPMSFFIHLRLDSNLILVITDLRPAAKF